MAFDAGEVFSSLIPRLADAGIQSFVKLGGGAVPDQLFVAFPPDAAGRVVHLQVMFLPGMEPVVVQFYAALPFGMAGDPRVLDRVARFLCAANVTLPVGQFGFAEDQRLLFFRHNLVVPPPPLNFDVFGWSVTMAQFVVSHLGPLVEAVAGGLDLVEARERLADALDDIDDTEEG